VPPAHTLRIAGRDSGRWPGVDVWRGQNGLVPVRLGRAFPVRRCCWMVSRRGRWRLITSALFVGAYPGCPAHRFASCASAKVRPIVFLDGGRACSVLAGRSRFGRAGAGLATGNRQPRFALAELNASGSVKTMGGRCLVVAAVPKACRAVPTLATISSGAAGGMLLVAGEGGGGGCLAPVGALSVVGRRGCMRLPVTRDPRLRTVMSADR